MNKIYNFLREVTNEYINKESLNFGISKVIDVLFELDVDDEKIIFILSKHFDLKYSDASNILNEAKEIKKQ